jgi:hypothetical protein
MQAEEKITMVVSNHEQSNDKVASRRRCYFVVCSVVTVLTIWCVATNILVLVIYCRQQTSQQHSIDLQIKIELLEQEVEKLGKNEDAFSIESIDVDALDQGTAVAGNVNTYQ